MFNIPVDLEDDFAKSKTVLGTRSSHHFVPISCNKITLKLTSEEIEFLQFDFNKSWNENKKQKHQVFFIYQLELCYILVGWHID